ncbi:hypothetical protein CFC21_056933, partial [Triticum aestivum]
RGGVHGGVPRTLRVILYLNYLYVRWSGRDGVHRTGSSTAAGRRGRGPAEGGSTRRRWQPCRWSDQGGGAWRRQRGKGGVRGGLSAMQDGDAVRALPGCRHAFHVGCVDVGSARTPPAPSARAPALRFRQRTTAPGGRRRPDGSRSWRARY